MFDFDAKYLIKTLSGTLNLPVRFFSNNNSLIKSPVKFSIDPVTPYLNDILSKKENIGYISTPDFFYYGYISYNKSKIIVGPARMFIPDIDLANKIAFELGIEKHDVNDFVNDLRSLPETSIESLMQTLISYNYFLNNEKLSIKNILIKDEINNKPLKNDNFETQHYTMDTENSLCRMIEHGDINELREWVNNLAAVTSGLMSNDSLRQVKNTFIVSATLASRAAIKGMLDPNVALSLSDLYIQKSEANNSIEEISTLQMEMMFDYTERVAKIRGKKDASAFLIGLNRYVYKHLSEAIKSSDLCKNLYVSKSVLFDKVKKETNMTVSEYILNIKVNESKGLLKYSDKSISAISMYLGFSSQSHYNRTFKQIVGITPTEYRNKYK